MTSIEMCESEKHDFLSVLLSALETSDTELVRQYLFDPENEEDVAACAFEALRPIHKAMLTLQDDDSFYAECIGWLIHLVNVGSPKEILLGLLELVEEEGTLVNCVPLIPLLQNTLLKLPAKRVSSLEWTLSALDKYIQQLPTPKDHHFEGEERKLLDLDADVLSITEVLSPYIVLIQSFVTEVSLSVCLKHKAEDHAVQQQNILIRFCLSLLSYPLAFMNLDHQSGAPKNKLRIIAEDCVFCVYNLRGYLFNIYQFAKGLDYTKNANIDMSLAVLAYLVFSENVSDICPNVYLPWYLLETHIHYAIMLISKTNTLLVSKGLNLAQGLLRRFSLGSLVAINLDFPELLDLCKKLFNVMIHCPAKDLRLVALKNLNLLVDLFDSKGTCQLLIALLQGHSNPMVQSLLLNVYKDKLHASLRNGIVNNPFVNNNLIRVLKIATKLETAKVETDLIDNSSRILSSLNVLRYVALTEKTTSLGVRTFLKTISGEFLEPLRLAINLSRAHYKKQLEDNKVSTKPCPDMIESVKVGNELLPELPPDYERQICATAITTFDVIESVMVRVEEILHDLLV